MVGAGLAAGGRRELGLRAEREPYHIDTLDLRQHLVAAESFPVQLVAGRAVGRFEDHRERLVSFLAPQVVRRPQEERFLVQTRARRLANGAAEVIGQRLAALEPRGDVIEHGLEALRRVIAVEAHHHRALLVEE